MVKTDDETTASSSSIVPAAKPTPQSNSRGLKRILSDEASDVPGPKRVKDLLKVLVSKISESVEQNQWISDVPMQPCVQFRVQTFIQHNCPDLLDMLIAISPPPHHPASR